MFVTYAIFIGLLELLGFQICQRLYVLKEYEAGQLISGLNTEYGVSSYTGFASDFAHEIRKRSLEKVYD